MNYGMKKLLLFALFLVSVAASAQKPIEMNLWPNGPSTDNGNPEDMAKVTIFLPDEKKATGRAVVCCPGGGYEHLAWEKEGTSWAPFFNGQGIALIVLKYRMPNGHYKVPAEDAEEAIRLVRRNASEWHINADDVGIMGFSAGGHLASTVATHASHDAMPNFQILFYPVISMEQGTTHQGSRNHLLGKNPKRKLINEYCNEQHVSKHTPRAFIVLAHDDKAVPPTNSIGYYEELYAHKVPASLHIFPTGGHGFGSLQSFAYHFEMMLALKAWLRSF
jgi:acetyl esterase/lipase